MATLFANPITYQGRIEFAENSRPALSKSEYGIDILRRTFIGASPLRAKFDAGLSQGLLFSYNGARYFLQSWEWDDNKQWPTVTLFYKGVASGKMPNPQKTNASIIQNVSISAEVTWTPPIDPEPEEPITETVTRDINYRAFQTNWRLVADSEPLGNPLVGVTSRAVQPQIISSRITTETSGLTYNGNNAPAALVAATTITPGYFMLDQNAFEVFGSPLWEVDEVVALMYLAP